MKIVFIGAAGVAFFRKNIILECMLSESLHDAEYVLYDIDKEELIEAEKIVQIYNNTFNHNAARISVYCGEKERRDALKGADFVINAILVGGAKTCAQMDFDIPKKYGLRQTIADTIGIGGIFRALRTIPYLKDITDDMEEVCPDAWFLNYTNPLAITTGYIQRYTSIKTVGLCYSACFCSETILNELDMKVDGYTEKIAGINHMAWLLEIKDLLGNDLYPEIRKRAKEKNLHRNTDMVRLDYIDKFGYYCTESSEHNAEYSMFYIKSKYPELIDKFNIPLDYYLDKHNAQKEAWIKEKNAIFSGEKITYNRVHELTAIILEAMASDTPVKIYGNVINNGLIDNLPSDACVEVSCLAHGRGIHPIAAGKLPPQLAALNMTNINVQLLTIEAAATKNIEHIYHAAMLDPHTGSELSIDQIRKLCDEMIDAHKAAGCWRL